MTTSAPLTGTCTVLPPPNSGATGFTSGPNPITVNNRTYTCAIGASLSTVPADDAAIMIDNGWVLFGRGSGATAARPTGINLKPGMLWYDTTVGHIIVYDGATWRDHDGTSV